MRTTRAAQILFVIEAFGQIDIFIFTYFFFTPLFDCVISGALSLE